MSRKGTSKGEAGLRVLSEDQAMSTQVADAIPAPYPAWEGVGVLGRR